MKVNDATIRLIKEFEGFRAEAYRDPVGVWTIGYGTTAAAGIGVDPKPGMKITEAQAAEYLRAVISNFASRIRPHILRPITDNQFGAFVSLAYNIGPSAFINSTALARFNAGDPTGAADAMTWFNKAGGRVLRGLERRRAAEVKLFWTPDPPKPADPTPAPAVGLWAAIVAAAVAAVMFWRKK